MQLFVPVLEEICAKLFILMIATPKMVFPAGAVFRTIAILAVLPVAVIAFYAMPVSDDYLYGCLKRDLDFITYLGNHYGGVHGRSGSASIMWLSPLGWGHPEWYGWVCVGFTVFFCWVLWYTSVYLLRIRGIKRSHPLHVLPIIMFFLGLHNLPEWAAWIPGISNYGVASILICVLAMRLRAVVVRGAVADARWPSLLPLALIAFLIPQCNETGLPVVLGLAFLAATQLRARRRVLLLWVVLPALAGTAMVACAPGVQVRMAMTPYARHPLQLVGITVMASAIFIGKALALQLSAVVAGYTLWPANAKPGGAGRHPVVLFAVVALCVLLGVFMMASFGLGGFPPGRVSNMVWINWLILGLFSLSLFGTGSVQAGECPPPKSPLPRWLQPLCCAAIVAELLFLHHPVSDAWKEIVSGKVQQYHAEMQGFDETARQPGEFTFWSITSVPKSLYISPPPDSVLPPSLPLGNCSYLAKFYRKRCIVVHNSGVVNDPEAGLEAALKGLRTKQK